jgi:cytochrome c peroxidase
MEQKQNMNFKIILLISVFSILLVSCSVDPEIREIGNSGNNNQQISFTFPTGFPVPVYSFQNNEVNITRFLLGKRLFKDPIFSRDNTISCESCHLQAASFAHLNHDLSHGIDDQLGLRNAPVLVNLAWMPNMMWDGGVNHIEVQPFAPITNPVEMDETLENVIYKLNNHPEYPQLFQEAYGISTITTQLMARALVQFLGNLISADSKYDRVVRLQDGTQFTAGEQRGFIFFNANCQNCHTPPLFTNNGFANNGLYLNYQDEGRKHITSLNEDLALFKIPTLRNIEVSFPYMHNGKMTSLNAVVEHYRSGIKNHINLHPSLKRNNQPGVPMTDAEKEDLIAFLRTLTDRNFLTNPLFR